MLFTGALQNNSTTLEASQTKLVSQETSSRRERNKSILGKEARISRFWHNRRSLHRPGQTETTDPGVDPATRLRPSRHGAIPELGLLSHAQLQRPGIPNTSNCVGPHHPTRSHLELQGSPRRHRTPHPRIRRLLHLRGLLDRPDLLFVRINPVHNRQQKRSQNSLHLEFHTRHVRTQLQITRPEHAENRRV